MAGILFKTAGVAGLHLLTEKLGTLASSEKRYRVTFRQIAFDESGASVTGGKIGIGVDKTITTVLNAGSATYVDSIIIENVYLEDICWNDFGTAVMLSLTWNEELQKTFSGDFRED